MEDILKESSHNHQHHHHHHHSNDDDNTNTNGDNLLLVKVLAMLILGLTSFLIGVLPIKLSKFFNIKSIDGDKNLLISLLLCFGGGVLLFTTFLHLQPEVRESFQMLGNRDLLPELGNIPISEIVFCFGFFFVYFIEELVHLYLHHRHIINDDDDDVLHRSLSVRCNKKQHNQLIIPRVTLNKFDEGGSNMSNSNKNLLSTITTATPTTISSSTSTLNQPQHHDHHDHHHHHHHIDNELIKSSFSGLLVVLALSFHAVFEGLAVGLETSTRNVWYLFAAIATHKLVIAFCVGVELVQSKTKTLLIFLYIGTFALVTPLGIGIGLILSETNLNGNDNSDDLVSPILQGMAAGTLLYVVFFEVLAREKVNQHSGIWQLFAILAGFVIMFCLQILTGHEHGHHDHHHSHNYTKSSL